MPGKFLANFELYVMLAILHLDSGAYGGAIRREIEGRTDRQVAIGALYATLDRLASKGLLEFDVTARQPGERGRPRKYCRLTSAGQEAVEHSASMLQRMMAGLAVANRGV